MTTKTVSAVELCSEMIRFPSVTPNDCGVQKHLADILESMSFTVHHLKFENINNFFAFKHGKSKNGKHFCFAGHTDVVPAGNLDEWIHDPFGGVVENGIVYGRGAVDMKGCIASFISALSKFIAEHGEDFNGTISLLITGDEEADAINGTVKVLEWMSDNDFIPDFCLLGEASNPDKIGQQIKTGRRGSFSGELTVKGKQGHVAYQHLADNPIPKMIKLLDVLNAEKWDNGNDFFPPSNLEITSVDVGNSAGNVIPLQCKAKFNIRFNDIWNAQKLESRIREILNASSINYELSTICGAESFFNSPCEYSQIIADAVKSKTEFSPEFTTDGGTSDARFIHKYCKVAEFGLTNETAHHINELTTASELELLSDIYEEILIRFFG